MGAFLKEVKATSPPTYHPWITCFCMYTYIAIPEIAVDQRRFYGSSPRLESSDQARYEVRLHSLMHNLKLRPYSVGVDILSIGFSEEFAEE